MGIWRLRIDPGLVPERPFIWSRRRSGASRRSMVAAETRSSLARTSGSIRSSPWRSMTSTISAMNGARRLPVGPSRVAHTRRRGSSISGP
jgi:hypothetical protein